VSIVIGSKSEMGKTFTLAVILFLLFAIPSFISSQYFLHIMILLFIYAMLAESWNLVGAFAGQLNLGHAAFFGTGAYTSALLYLADTSIPLCIGIGSVVAAFFAFLLSPTFRLRGVYFGVGTLALSEAMRVVVTNMNALGGASGLRLRALSEYGKTQYYYIALVILLLCLFIIYWIMHSKTGMALKALCRSEEAAESLGINPGLYKIKAFIISALFAGASGGFYASYILFIEPSNVFSVFWTFNPIFAVILGGSGTFLGPIVGSAVFVMISEITVGFGKMSSFLAGALLIAVITLMPKGVMGYVGERSH